MPRQQGVEMSEVFIGQVMSTAFNFPPRGFALCNGQLLPINQNQALFSLLGTMYGGDGITSFALPDLRGRTPLGAGGSVDPAWQPQQHPVGQPGGTESVTLTTTSLPSHNHQLNAVTAPGAARNPANSLYGTTTSAIYAQASGAQVVLDATTVGKSGGGNAHQNMQPFQVINYCIALTGIFPSRN